VKIFSRLPSVVDPLKLALLGISAWAVLLGSCSQNPITVRLHAMQTSGRVSFVCRGADNSPFGHKLDECPDYELGTRHTLGLVTQTSTNEVAVVDLSAESIVDVDQTSPGYSFLRVGASPGAIVTTPGGAASFVGVSGLTKNGIFALPTTCVLPPRPGEAARDLTSWSACHLSSAPGDISVVLDPVLDGDAPRASCPNLLLPPIAPKQFDACPADLTKESGPVGRRKLLVALPDEHKLVLLDAQRLLDREPGSFAECEPEATFKLDAPMPTTPLGPIVPDDLKPLAGVDPSACLAPSYPALDASVLPTPGGFAAAGDRMYVADRTRPVVHVLDLSDPCQDKELPPLLPYSYSTPERVVTTSRVAVSPLSPSGQQFVYAIDQDDQPAASVMVFDLGRIAADDPKTRTPKIFEGTTRQQYMPPDRLKFDAPVRDISFVMRDFPKPDATGTGKFGAICDPNPDASGPVTAYRPNADFTDGARPVNLRGVFAFAMLSNGQIAVIDVEDFDAACRRPVTSNPGSFEDLHGCSGDPIAGPFTDAQGLPTVSGESSCNIVEPHRPRSASLSISSSSNGLRAPTLRTFPQFSNPDPSVVVSLDRQPRLLATDFANPDSTLSETLPAEVNISTQLYAHCTERTAGRPPCDGSAQPLVIDPRLPSVQNSLTLPLIEPRSYAVDETPTLVFEGRLFNQSTSGFLQFERGAAQGTLRDPDANFCGVGVEDSDTIRAQGTALGIPAARLDAWAAEHADYVQITGDFPPVEDRYWAIGHGSECAALINPDKPNVDDRDACVRMFGSIENPSVLKTSRDLSIVSAYGGMLTVTPRGAANLDQLSCCFPAGTAYTVRAANQWLLTGTPRGLGLHDIALGPNGRCQHTASCDRRKRYFNQRAFEVCDPSIPFGSHPDEKGEPVLEKCELDNPKIGCIGEEFPVVPGAPASQCIFENLTSRFVVYRGAQPTIRGMTFSWQTTGGFVPQSMSLLSQSNAVSPQSMAYLPELGYLAVVDASTLGLTLFNLNSLGVVLPSPYY
jgi:hypothetical protein